MHRWNADPGGESAGLDYGGVVMIPFGPNVYVGSKNGKAVYVSENAIAQLGLYRIKDELGLLNWFSVRTGFGKNDIVSVQAETYEEAVKKYLEGTKNARPDTI